MMRAGDLRTLCMARALPLVDSKNVGEGKVFIVHPPQDAPPMRMCWAPHHALRRIGSVLVLFHLRIIKMSPPA